MSFVTANHWSQGPRDHQTRADQRIVDVSTVHSTSYAAGSASARLTTTV
ncbi:hypothetical protein [Mycobacterium sp. 852002-40037_SCH5390672]|nr:hypothetical protein [Mycobacterium sp. 852002-40037_SCH5390672]